VKVIFTNEALQNLRDIGDYIAEDNPSRALTFVRELREKALGIGRMPRAYPLVGQFDGDDVRRRVHGDYLILYTVEAERVLILFITHGARDYEALLTH
jgi:toxin ParE1/3/4